MKIKIIQILCLFSAVILSPLTVAGQACPACSNPALQSSEKIEAGLDTLQKGSIRLTFNLTNGFNYQGGHPSWKGLTPDRQVVYAPLHDHIVSLDFLRSEVSLEYVFKTNWSIWMRIPYDMKMQEATIEYIDPVTEEERENIIRNRDIHHRNSTYSGFSDLRLLASHRINGFLSKNGRLDVALGSSLPVGRTEGNPLTAGKNGEKHMHIQFGTGTFDPLLELHYAGALSDKTSFSVFTINKFPFYTNDHGYKGSAETTSGISLSYRLMEWMSIAGTLANFSQSYARWDGVKDPNSGLISFNGNLGLTFRTAGGLLITPGYRFPIHQKTLSEEGDTFNYGPTFLFNISYVFN